MKPTWKLKFFCHANPKTSSWSQPYPIIKSWSQIYLIISSWNSGNSKCNSLHSIDVPYCQHVVVTKLIYKENNKVRTISRLFQVSCCYIRPILGHSTLENYAKKCNRQRKGNQKAWEGRQDHIINYNN